MQPNIPEITRLSPGFAYRVRDYISAIRDAMQLLSNDQTTPTGVRDKIDYLNAHLTSVAQCVRQYQIISNIDDQCSVNASLVLSSLKSLLQKLLKGHSLEVNVDCSLWPIRCDSAMQLEELIILIVANLRDAMHKSGAVRIRARNDPQNVDHTQGHIAATDQVVIEIADTGVGMPGTIIDQIFDPFFSTKGTGCGFSLAQVRTTVARLGGRISLTSEVDKGTIISLTFPRYCPV